MGKIKLYKAAHTTLPPTVAPMRATASSIGILKTELSASQVSAKALEGVENIKTLLAKNISDGNLCCLSSWQGKQLQSYAETTIHEENS